MVILLGVAKFDLHVDRGAGIAAVGAQADAADHECGWHLRAFIDRLEVRRRPGPGNGVAATRHPVRVQLWDDDQGRLRANISGSAEWRSAISGLLRRSPRDAPLGGNRRDGTYQRKRQ